VIATPDAEGSEVYPPPPSKAASIDRAASTTAPAYRRAAPRDSRDDGPETDTTATRPPSDARTGALTDPTPI